MKKTVNKIKLLSFGFSSLTFISVILRTINLLTAFDSNVGYFDESSPLTHITRVSAIISILFGVVLVIMTKKGKLSDVPPSHNLWTSTSSIILGFVFLIFSPLFFMLNMKDLSPTVILIIIGALISSVFFVIDGIRAQKEWASPTSRALLTIVSCLTLIGICLSEYFNYFVALNNPEKILVSLTFISAAVLLMQNARFKAGNPQPRVHLIFSYAVAFLGAYTSIPGIIGNLAGVLTSPSYLVYYLICFGITIYAAANFFSHTALSVLCEESKK